MSEWLLAYWPYVAGVVLGGVLGVYLAVVLGAASGVYIALRDSDAT